MKKIICALLVSVILSGCSQTISEISEDINARRNNPNAFFVTNEVKIQNKGLEGCVYQRINPDNDVPVLHVLRCPNSTTTTSWASGKTKQAVSTVEN